MASGNYIIVMEYLGSEWIDLYDYIEMHGPVREDYAKEIFKQVVETVEFLHEKGYSHNDIKGIFSSNIDENILINPETRELKLIDFGSTTLFHPKQAHTLFYGTKKFAAPESLENTEYLAGPQEAWCLGTLLYVLLFKMDPFKDDVEIINLDISRRIERLREAGHAYGGASISQAAVELMVGLMNKNPVKRIDCLEIKESTWFS